MSGSKKDKKIKKICEDSARIRDQQLVRKIEAEAEASGRPARTLSSSSSSPVLTKKLLDDSRRLDHHDQYSETVYLLGLKREALLEWSLDWCHPL